MSDQRSIDEAIAAVTHAAASLELPVTVEYDRGSDGRRHALRARLVDENGVFLAELHEITVDSETAVDRQAEEMAIILNDAGPIAATLAKLLATAGTVARMLDVAAADRAGPSRAALRGLAETLRAGAGEVLATPPAPRIAIPSWCRPGAGGGR